jgi:predicted DCC family thiol-disulfide oxidoreductase YuxK
MIKVYYDNHCKFCSAGINILRIKSSGQPIFYDSLSNLINHEYIRNSKIEQPSIDSIVVEADSKYYYYTEALSILFHKIGGIYSIFGFFLDITPLKFRNSIYKAFATHRYSLSGGEKCSITKSL